MLANWLAPFPAVLAVGPYLTTILDPAQAPTAALAALYHERWEIEGALTALRLVRRSRGLRMYEGANYPFATLACCAATNTAAACAT